MERINWKKDIIFITILTILCFIVSWPLLTSQGVLEFDDIQAHPYKLSFLAESVSNGDYFPKWSSDWYGGFPIFSIYPNFSYYLFLPIAFLGPFAPKLALFIAHFIAVIFAYYFAKTIFKDKFNAFLAAAIYSFFPYKIGLITGVFAEHTATMFIPMTLYFFQKFRQTKKTKWATITSILIGFTLCTHHVVGATLLGALVFIVLYDCYYERKRYISVIGLFFVGILISSSFLIPAYFIKEDLNFKTIQKFKTDSFSPLKPSNLVDRDGMASERTEYIGYLGLILLIAGLYSTIKRKELIPFALIAIILFIVGIYLWFLIPGMIRSTMEFAFRFYSILGLFISLLIVSGINLINQEIKKRINTNLPNYLPIAIASVLIIILLVDFSAAIPKAKTIDLPDNLVQFYEKASGEEEYYRIEDQNYFKFGASTLLHGKGVLNGGFSQAAPKNHFEFWNSAWELIKTENPENFAKVYGALSIKYMVFNKQSNLPGLKSISKTGILRVCDGGACIYENKYFQSHVRSINKIITVNDIQTYFTELGNDSFDNLAYALTDKKYQDKKLANVILLEKKSGYFKINVNNNTETYVTITESHNPNWKATINDEPVEIIEGIPSSLIIPIQGNGVLEVKYKDHSFRTPLFILVIVSMIVILASWKLRLPKFKLPKLKWTTMVLILILIFTLYTQLLYFDINEAIFQDSAEYLLEAKQLALGIDAPTFAAHRGIFLPLLWSLIFKIGLGENTILLLQIAFLIGSVYASYLLGKTIFNTKVGLITAFFTSVFWQYSFWSHRFLTEVPSIFFFIFGLYFFWQAFMKNKKKFFIPFFIALMLGILTRFPTGMLLIVVGVFLLINLKFSFLKIKEFYFGAILAGLLGILYFIYGTITYNRIDFLFNEVTRHQSRGGISVLIEYLKFMPDYLGWPLLCLLCISIILYVTFIVMKFKQNLLFPIVGIIITLFTTAFMNEFIPRMAIFVFPFIFLITAKLCYDAYKFLNRIFNNINPNIGLFVILIVILIAAIPQMTQTHSSINNLKGSMLYLKEAGLWLNENMNENETCLSKSAFQLGYYSEKRCWSLSDNVELLPKYNYLILSVYEPHEEWQLTYPKNNNLKPVKVFYSGDKPIVIIYR